MKKFKGMLPERTTSGHLENFDKVQVLCWAFIQAITLTSELRVDRLLLSGFVPTEDYLEIVKAKRPYVLQAVENWVASVRDKPDNKVPLPERKWLLEEELPYEEATA